LTMALEVTCHPFIDGQACVFGGATGRLWWNFFSFLPSFLSLYLRFHINPFENKMCHVSLYLYQFWSSFFWFIFVLLLMLFEINIFFSISSLDILFHLFFLSNLVLIFLSLFSFFFMNDSFSLWFFRVCLLWDKLVSCPELWVLKISLIWFQYFLGSFF
jgi:hypothetical protein